MDIAKSLRINQERADASIKKHDAICKSMGNTGCNCSKAMGCKFNNWKVQPKDWKET